MPSTSVGPEDIGGGTRPVLKLLGIRKEFGDVVALDGVNLWFASGEVHALLGENGAGKSTLMNVVAGFLAADAGEVRLNDTSVLFRSPRDALAMGIGMVHQHFRLVEQFTVAENLAIGSHDPEGGQADRVSVIDRANRLAERFGLPIDPNRPVWQLSVGEKQRVEILRTLARGPKVLVLDEPTAVLAPQESEALFVTVRRMAAEGTCVVFISHKLKEVLAVADRVTVMRRGRIVNTLPRAECDIAGLAQLMVGHGDHTDTFRAEPGNVQAGAPALDVGDLTARDERGLLALDHVSLVVRRGEIVGVAGVAGNGQQELEEIITGLRLAESGKVKVMGRALTGKPVRRFIEAGVAHIPDDRKGRGLVPSESIWRNAILKRYRQAPVARGWLVRGGEARRVAEELARRVNLSTQDVSTAVQHLSGGNAQKLLAGRELEGERQVVVAVNPTQGLDVGAAAAVWGQLIAARDRLVGVLLISADLDEVLGLSDRVLVLYEGRIVGQFERGSLNRERIGLLMGGGDDRKSANA